MAVDPICKMEVDEESANWTSEHEGKTYYFCNRGCKVTFDENPDYYLAGGETSRKHAC
jgi:YHS domain-containing protein